MLFGLPDLKLIDIKSPLAVLVGLISWFSFQDESQDHYKREQLRELAMLKSNLREESPQPYGSVSPFTSSGMKRAKTGL